MRKDVILGMTIGGVMLALIVIYLTVSTATKPNKHAVDIAAAQPADVGSTDVGPSGAGDDGSSAGRAPLDLRSQSRIDPARDRGNYRPTILLAGDQERRDEKWGEKLFGKASPANVIVTPDPNRRPQLLEANSGGGGEQSQGAGDEQPGSPGTGNGAKTVRTASNKPAEAAAKPPQAAADPRRPNGGAGTVAGGTSAGGSAGAGAGANGPQATDSAPDNSGRKLHTHKVQKGETYSTIAAAAYGSPNFYPHLIRANPKVDPTHLKPGMEINIPDISEVKPSGGKAEATAADPNAPPAFPDAGPAGHRTEPVIDSRTEYRVQSGDSLHKIAIKLYGKVDMVDRIYELNQAAIGPDKAKLKLGMVLKLPEAPTANR